MCSGWFSWVVLRVCQFTGLWKVYILEKSRDALWGWGSCICLVGFFVSMNVCPFLPNKWILSPTQPCGLSQSHSKTLFCSFIWTCSILILALGWRSFLWSSLSPESKTSAWWFAMISAVSQGVSLPSLLPASKRNTHLFFFLFSLQVFYKSPSQDLGLKKLVVLEAL